MMKWFLIFLSILCVGCTKPAEKNIDVSIEIRCENIFNSDEINPRIIELQPTDGIILEATFVNIRGGSSVFDVLKQICIQEKIHMEFVNTPLYNSAYIEGINNLYEFNAGALSGWKYSVNNEVLSIGSSNVEVSENDKISFFYTVDGDF